MSDSFVTPWTVGHQAPLSVACPRPEYWSRLPFPSLDDLPDPGVEPMSPALQEDSFTTEPTGKPYRKEAITQLMGLGQRSEQNHSKAALKLRCCGAGRDLQINTIIFSVYSAFLIWSLS